MKGYKVLSKDLATGNLYSCVILQRRRMYTSLENYLVRYEPGIRSYPVEDTSRLFFFDTLANAREFREDMMNEGGWGERVPMEIWQCEAHQVVRVTSLNRIITVSDIAWFWRAYKDKKQMHQKFWSLGFGAPEGTWGAKSIMITKQCKL